MLKQLLLLVLLISTLSAAESPLAPLDASLTAIIQRYFPEAQIQRADNSFTAKHGTMEYTVHARSKTGEVFAQTHKEEGPNFTGFILSIRVNDGPYQGAAVVPQHLKEPYWTTYIQAEPVPNQDKHFFIHFSYGGRLNPEFQKAFYNALKVTK
jgi:hypothetical protein